MSDNPDHEAERIRLLAQKESLRQAQQQIQGVLGPALPVIDH